MVPTDRRYTKEHEWILIEGGVATIGITDFAQDQLGDIVYVEVPEVGSEVSRGDVMGTIESVKAVSEVFAPVGGKVTEVNENLDAAPETLNGDPHGAGWYCKMEIGNAGEIEELLDSAAYEALVASSS